MLLVADVGNTHTVLGLFDDKILLHKWAVQTNKDRTCDEWGLHFRTFFDLRRIPINQVEGFVIGSVVPPAVRALEEAGNIYLDTSVLVVGPGVKTGISIRYDNPKEIGADRIVNAVAVSASYDQAAIVVDFGTATTFDCISTNGDYLGGIICPGVAISLDALFTRTAKLPKINISPPKSAIGKNTEHAMQAGIVLGYAAMVDGLINRLTAEMGGTPITIATGGLSKVITRETTRIDRLEPNLTLDGLRILFERNRG